MSERSEKILEQLSECTDSELNMIASCALGSLRIRALGLGPSPKSEDSEVHVDGRPTPLVSRTSLESAKINRDHAAILSTELDRIADKHSMSSAHLDHKRAKIARALATDARLLSLEFGDWMARGDPGQEVRSKTSDSFANLREKCRSVFGIDS